MANTNTPERIIKTVILLRSDILSNWEAVKDTFIPRQGEVCLTIDKENGSSGKVGVGDKTWGELPYVFGPLATTGSTPGTGGVNFTPDGKAFQLTDADVLTLIGLNTANPGESFRITEDGTSIEWFVTASKEEVAANKTLIDQINETLTNDYYTKAEVDAKVGSVFTFKGHVADMAALNAITSPENGDAYVVDSENALYVYSTADGWKTFPLGVDVSQFVLTTDFTPVKDTVDSLPDTIISKVEATVATNGAIEIRTNTSTKGTDGRYTSDGDHTILNLDEVVANGTAGLMSGADKAKLDMLVETSAEGGQANIIDSITVAGQAAPVDSNKNVNIPVAGAKFGVVKNYTGTDDEKPQNVVVVDENGVMTVPEVNVDSLVQTEDWIISGGGAND